MSVRRLGLLLAMATFSSCHAQGVEPRSSASHCKPYSFENQTFTDCVALPNVQSVRLVLDGPDGKPLRSLKALASSVASGNTAFAVNGGMFDTSGKPIGLLVLAGKQIHALNRQSGTGNFYLQPNGVFSVEADGWHVRTAAAYQAAAPVNVRAATQSGPMLIIDGRLHPLIAPDGSSRNIRNAVGIDNKGAAHFVISEDPVSFGVLARFMRDSLHCNNALYLDGFVSSLWDAANGRIDNRAQLGPLLLVENSGKVPKS